jgi:hypothetical protein
MQSPTLRKLLFSRGNRYADVQQTSSRNIIPERIAHCRMASRRYAARLYVVFGFRIPGVASTVSTAEQLASALGSMSDNLTSAVFAYGSKLVNRAFKAVEDMAVTRRDHLETEFVVVTANFALCHGSETLPDGLEHVLTVTRAVALDCRAMQGAVRRSHAPPARLGAGREPSLRGRFSL